jgi:hypothetical protein
MEGIMTKRFDPGTISDDELLNELRILAATLGKTPSRSDMTKRGNSTTKRLYLYDRRFGGLSEACEVAGLSANLGGKDLEYSDDELLQHIVDLKSLLGRTPTQEDITTAGKYAIGAFKRHFGTYNNALKRLGLRHNMKFGFSPQEIINDILRVAVEIGRSPTAYEFWHRSNTVSYITASEKLGLNRNWNKTLKKCGLKVLNNRNITDDELKEEVERLNIKLGRLPGYYDMVQVGVYSPETYADRFGSYTKALKHFGYDYVPDSQWQNQTYTKGSDGVLYRSKFEANIANALLSLKTSGVITSYEYEKIVCSERKWTCDFFVKTQSKELWIEADGMGKNRFDPYDLDNEKIEFYTANNYKYLIIPYKKIDLEKYILGLIY